MQRMIPAFFAAAMKNPGAMEQQVRAWLAKQGYNVQNDKTLARTAFYHWRDINGLQQEDFFTGQVLTNQTNLQSFVRPQSEHFIAMGIRIETGTGADPNNIDWLPGLQYPWAKQTHITIVSNGVVQADKYPLTEALTDLFTADNGYIPFSLPWVWGGQESLKISLVNQTNQPGPAQSYLKMTLIGLGLIS